MKKGALMTELLVTKCYIRPRLLNKKGDAWKRIALYTWEILLLVLLMLLLAILFWHCEIAAAMWSNSYWYM